MSVYNEVVEEDLSQGLLVLVVRSLLPSPRVGLRTMEDAQDSADLLVNGSPVLRLVTFTASRGRGYGDHRSVYYTTHQ